MIFTHVPEWITGWISNPSKLQVRILPWVLCIALSLALAAGCWWLSRPVSSTTQLDELQRIHQQELDSVLQAHLQERQELEANAQVLQRQLSAITATYEARLEEIERARDKRATTIVSDYSDDMDGLAELVAQTYGFKVQ